MKILALKISYLVNLLVKANYHLKNGLNQEYNIKVMRLTFPTWLPRPKLPNAQL